MTFLPALTSNPPAALLSAVAALAYAFLAWAHPRLTEKQTRGVLATAWVLHLFVLGSALMETPARFGFAPALSVTAWLVLTVYLIESRLGSAAEFQFLRDLAAGHFLVDPVPPGDWPRIAELVWRYRDLPLGTVDASVIAAAERLKAHEIATLDRRHFTVVRPEGISAFELLPHSL